MDKQSICGIQFDQFVLEMESFHGARAPGMVVGGLMLESALAEVGETPDLAVVVETYNCLPDAVQILTHCTIGNGGLTIYDWGKFALTAYNRRSLVGVRTFVDSEGVVKWPLIDQWFNPSKPRSGPPDFLELAAELIRAKKDLIGIQNISMKSEEGGGQKKKTSICPACEESYFLKCGPLCSACQGMAYYITPGAETK